MLSPAKESVPVLVINLALRLETHDYALTALSDPSHAAERHHLVSDWYYCRPLRRFSSLNSIHTCGIPCIFFSLMCVATFSLAFNLQSTFLTRTPHRFFAS